MTDVFILGAGFSRAISTAMPTVNELGLAVLRTQRSIHGSKTQIHSDQCDGLSCDFPVLPPGVACPDDFESWLSSLAEPQPYLHGPENDRRRAIFDELAGVIDIRIKQAENQAMSGVEPPEWLTNLIITWHSWRANVITFNYDTIVEATVDWVRLANPQGTNGEAITHHHVGPSIVPNWAPMWTGPRLAPAQTFNYFKLHGSTHWRWDEMTRAADSIVQVGLRSGWNRGIAYSTDELDFRAPGKVPLIVPPTTGKSIYLDNPIIRYLWRTAHQRLMEADRVFVIGYSLPPGDLLVRSMLDDALRVREGTSIWIVNPDGSVAERFAKFGREVIATYCGDGYTDMEAFGLQYLEMGQ
jgi:hypothetical protein